MSKKKETEQNITVEKSVKKTVLKKKITRKHLMAGFTFGISLLPWFS